MAHVTESDERSRRERTSEITSHSALTCRQRSFTNHRLAINFRLSEQSLLLCFRRTINHGGRVAVCCTTHCILFISSVQLIHDFPRPAAHGAPLGVRLSVCLSVLTNRWRERASERTIHWREWLTPAEMIVWSHPRHERSTHRVTLPPRSMADQL